MDYIYIPNGQKVQVVAGKTLPPALYKPLEAPKPAPKAPRKRVSKPKEQ